MVKKILSCLGEYKKYAILTPVIIVGEVIMETLIPMVMAQMVDRGVANKDMSFILKMGALMILMAVISLTCGVLAGKFAATASMGLAKGIRKKEFYNISNFAFSNIDKIGTASLITRLTTDVTNTQNAFQMIIRMAVRAPLMFISATVMAVLINAKLSLIVAVAIPFLSFVLYFIATSAYPRFMEMLSKYDKLNARVQENLIAIRVVKSFVRGDYECEEFEKAADAVRNAQLRAERVVIWNMPAMQFSMYACTIAVSYFGGVMIIGGSFKVGALMSFVSYILQILLSLMMISMMFVMLVLSRASIQRIGEVLEEESDIKDDKGNEELKVEDGSIKFKDVAFSYANDPGNLTLESIDFEIKSGETIGIIGGTGSAKTSLVQLIPRLYDVIKGQVIVGGHDVREYKLNNLRDEVAMVLQKNVLFSGTIEDNLRWGDKNASMNEIEEACKAACAHDFIMEFPNGYKTDLGQGGVNVSGGQKQRICIARALLKKPKIIILDDSTSAVDTATDAHIRQAFKEKLSDTTTIIIAQRISSVADADRIIVLDQGKINAIGTHEELLKSNEIYKEVYESQQKGAA
ncbi:ATP-binding cassette, subfamily B [Acetitomaculum ruminis DSM 5522]|uniref:ATP-binding cassette, subfamily B n=1 Tax=Acetitomaculum ruminis DSM 5522 TaxID=1120918 RepID=A0A1I0X1I2_9FIRM|nr:ABC transporter ATP-binding protein [Acetitomaculum ruminis]SFA94226.1 ATP-binding cassette, subfamily B [Acetitomaculum ruminis DSM 5522]